MFNLETFHLKSCLRSHVKEEDRGGPTPTHYLPKRCVPNLLRSTNTWVPNSKRNFGLTGLGHLNRNIEHDKKVCIVAKKKGKQNDRVIHAAQNPGQNDRRSLLEPKRYFQYARFIPTCSRGAGQHWRLLWVKHRQVCRQVPGVRMILPPTRSGLTCGLGHLSETYETYETYATYETYVTMCPFRLPFLLTSLRWYGSVFSNHQLRGDGLTQRLVRVDASFKHVGNDRSLPFVFT